MKPLVIAATTLALAGAALAQSDATPGIKAAPVTAAAPAKGVADAVGQVPAGSGEPVQDAAAAAEAAPDATDGGVQPAEAVPVVPPDVNAPAISEAEPGVLSSWVTSRRIWTTNQPSSTEWVEQPMEERPAEWQDIAKVNDIVMDDSGKVVGYIADIGGFLGIGAKKVLLGEDAIHLITIGSETFFATNYTKAELEALPDFDEKTVRK
jgi:hypothetical protein